MERDWRLRRARGVRKLLIFNGHGGQVSAMDIVARELRVKHRLLVYSTSWFSLVDEAANQQFCDHEHRFRIHGGEVDFDDAAPRT